MNHKKSYSLPAPPSSSSLSSQPPTYSLGSTDSSLIPTSPLKRYRSDRPSRLTKVDFVEHLARSNFSFLMGASHPDEMVLRAKQLGYLGLTLCDVNGLYGVVRGYQAAEKPSLFDATQMALHHATHGHESNGKFRYHVGAELTPFDAAPISLIPTSKEGYSRLSRLITRVKRPAAKARLKLSLQDILEEAGHATGDLLAMPLPPWNTKDIEKLVDAFGDRLYLPVHKDSTWESIELARQAIQLENHLGPSGLKLFATQRPLFHVPERKPLHDVVTCILHGTTLNQAKTRLTLNSERYLRPIDELRLFYRDRPDLLTRTVEISDRISFTLDQLKYKYPQEALPPGWSSQRYLRELAEKGMRWRYPPGTDPLLVEKARRQLEHELKLIEDLEYEDYFLTLYDICEFAREKHILHQGRGSAANSIVCFTLGLTAIDPIKLGLLFERFLSRERAEPPDIDIDFEHERREEVIQYIYRKYGAAHAAMVCTTVCFRSRMAVREVAKVMGASLEQTDNLVKAMGREGLSHLLSTPFDIAKFGITEEKFRMILKIAAEIKGFPRHLGIHSGGFVISHEPIVDIVPVEAATMTDRYVIQWNKDDVNLLGLMKLDILSLGMLTAIRKAFGLLKEKKKIHMGLASIPQDDEPTYKMIQKADTIGVFQIESRAQMSLLPRLRPKDWYDLVVQVAIVRPGPILGGLVHPYLKRRAGTEKVTYAHKDLIPILGKTLGVPIFQEQVMQIVVAVAGFTGGEADELRRVVSSAWRKKAVMHGLRQRLINGMLNHGLTAEYAEQIYKVIEGFSEYGFPESHAASFALLTYVSCWLKKHHPDVFATALLNSQPMGFYPPRQLIADAERHGVPFLPLDVQHSEWDYTMKSGLETMGPQTTATPHAVATFRSTATPAPVAQRFYVDESASSKPRDRRESAPAVLTRAPNRLHHVRVGFRSISGFQEADARIITDARTRGGVFRDVEDLVRRTGLPKKVLTKLATAGALFQLSPDPRQALFALQGIDFNQQSFFYGTEPLGTIFPFETQGITKAKMVPDDGRESIPQESEWEHVVREYDTKGFSLTSHPIAVIRKTAVLKRDYQTAEALPTLRNGLEVKLVGLRSLLQKPPTAKGVCFVSLEDETGIFNVIVMPDVYEKIRLILYSSNILEVRGTLQNVSGIIHVKAKDIRTFRLPGNLITSRQTEST